MLQTFLDGGQKTGHLPGPRHQEEEGDLASGVQAEEQDQRFRR